MTSRIVLGLLACSTAVFANLSGQNTRNLPPPERSRPPFLTQVPADSIRLQVAQLRLSQLLQELQRGDARAVDDDLVDVEWGPADQISQSYPQCASIGTALSLAASRMRTFGSIRVPVFFDRSRSVDSGSVRVLSTDLIVIRASGQQRLGAIRLVLDSTETKWVKGSGLWLALCAVATEPAQ